MVFRGIKRKWLKDRFKSNKHFIKDLQVRISEVIHRGKHACNHTFPDEYLERPFEDLIEWVLTPHIKATFTHYDYISPEMERGAERAVQKIMELRERFEQKGTNKTE